MRWAPARAGKAAVSLLFGIAAACGTVQGDDPYASWDTYEHPSGAFHFHCPLPPFEELEQSTPARPLLGVAVRRAATASDPGARLRLEARMAIGGSPAQAAHNALEGWLERGYELVCLGDFTNRAGDTGVRLEVRNDGAAAVQVMFEGEGGTVSLLIWGSGEIRDPDVDLLLESFEPRPAEDQEG
ncbi:MAG: hypothetical protein R6V85_16845 [Polyangia bacterium]